jgi:hypothetical protein
MPDEKFSTYDEFWPHYLRAHRDPRTRLTHYLGTSAGLLLAAAAAIRTDWRLLVAAPIVGYACAWFAHFVFEGNRPATFGHPLWSFGSDFRMLALWAAGRLGPELARAEAGRKDEGGRNG